MPIDWTSIPDDDTVGEKLHGRIRELYPIPRSLTGDGVRRTLAVIGSDLPLDVVETPIGDPGLRLGRPARVERPRRMGRGAGRQAPREVLRLVAQSARLQRPGRRHADARGAARARLHGSSASRPRAVPHLVLGRALGLLHEPAGGRLAPRRDYRAHIDATLADGSLTYGEVRLAGASSRDRSCSRRRCATPRSRTTTSRGSSSRPLSRRRCLPQSLRYSYRVVWSPGTIGPLCWLHHNLGLVGEIQHGLAISCVGDPGRRDVQAESSRVDRDRPCRRSRPRPPRPPRRSSTGHPTAATSDSSARPASIFRSARSPAHPPTRSPSTTRPTTTCRSSRPKRSPTRIAPLLEIVDVVRAGRRLPSTRRRTASHSSVDAGCIARSAEARAARRHSSGS